MSERVEMSLEKATRKEHMPEMLCICEVINKKGKPDTIERYAYDFAGLLYFLFTYEKIQKLISYKVAR